ncbi:MAG: hypothetical protein ABMB14_07840, partial [Myxococcota bacterium]
QDELGAAAAAHAEAESVVLDRVDDPDRLVTELVSLGGVADGPAPAVTVAFARGLARSARTVVGRRATDPDDEVARQRLERVVWAVDRLDRAHQDWVDVASEPTGRLALAVGRGTPPPP